MGKRLEALINQPFNFPRIGDQPSLFEAKIMNGASRLEGFRQSWKLLFPQFVSCIPASKNASFTFPPVPLMLNARNGGHSGIGKASL